jgi:hypothetical protein
VSVVPQRREGRRAAERTHAARDVDVAVAVEVPDGDVGVDRRTGERAQGEGQVAARLIQTAGAVVVEEAQRRPAAGAEQVAVSVAVGVEGEAQDEARAERVLRSRRRRGGAGHARVGRQRLGGGRGRSARNDDLRRRVAVEIDRGGGVPQRGAGPRRGRRRRRRDARRAAESHESGYGGAEKEASRGDVLRAVGVEVAGHDPCRRRQGAGEGRHDRGEGPEGLQEEAPLRGRLIDDERVEIAVAVEVADDGRRDDSPRRRTGDVDGGEGRAALVAPDRGRSEAVDDDEVVESVGVVVERGVGRRSRRRESDRRLDEPGIGRKEGEDRERAARNRREHEVVESVAVHVRRADGLPRRRGDEQGRQRGRDAARREAAGSVVPQHALAGDEVGVAVEVDVQRDVGRDVLRNVFFGHAVDRGRRLGAANGADRDRREGDREREAGHAAAPGKAPDRGKRGRRGAGVLSPRRARLVPRRKRAGIPGVSAGARAAAGLRPLRRAPGVTRAKRRRRGRGRRGAGVDRADAVGGDARRRPRIRRPAPRDDDAGRARGRRGARLAQSERMRVRSTFVIRPATGRTACQ